MSRRPEHEVNKCPECGAEPGERCVTISGNYTSQAHLPRWAERGTYRERRIYAPYRRRTTSATNRKD